MGVGTSHRDKGMLKICTRHDCLRSEGSHRLCHCICVYMCVYGCVQKGRREWKEVGTLTVLKERKSFYESSWQLLFFKDESYLVALISE